MNPYTYGRKRNWYGDLGASRVTACPKSLSLAAAAGESLPQRPNDNHKSKNTIQDLGMTSPPSRDFYAARVVDGWRVDVALTMSAKCRLCGHTFDYGS